MTKLFISTKEGEIRIELRPANRIEICVGSELVLDITITEAVELARAILREIEEKKGGD